MSLFGCITGEEPQSPAPLSAHRKGLGQSTPKSTSDKSWHFLSPEKLFVLGTKNTDKIKNQVETCKRSGVLVLSNLMISAIPNQVWETEDLLKTLDLSHNKLNSLPDKIATLRNLKSLSLNQNRLQELPECIGELESLEILSVSYNFLSTVPPALASLYSLRELRLSANRIAHFPSEVLSLPNLDLLDLSLNKIIELPEQGLESLTVVELNLNENELGYLGDSLAKAPRLKILRLQNNHLSLNSIPENLLADSGVNSLLLEGNLFELKALGQLEGFDQYMERYAANRKEKQSLATRTLQAWPKGGLLTHTFREEEEEEGGLCGHMGDPDGKQ